jgi:ABC-type glutathione transport system ATPase component
MRQPFASTIEDTFDRKACAGTSRTTYKLMQPVRLCYCPAAPPSLDRGSGTAIVWPVFGHAPLPGRDYGFVFQDPAASLNPVLTVGFQVAEVLRRHRGMDAAAADAETLRLLELVRIPDARRRMGEHPHSFSGGMRQRAMIAMALACRPKLLIADEPTTALDVTIQAQILELIRELQSEIGMSVMFITHDMGVVAEIADRVVVMLKGEKVEEGPAASLFRAPQHGYTKMLLGAVPKLGALAATATPRRFPAMAETGPGPEPQDEPDELVGPGGRDGAGFHHRLDRVGPVGELT